MKKIISLVMCTVLCFGLVACSDSSTIEKEAAEVIEAIDTAYADSADQAVAETVSAEPVVVSFGDFDAMQTLSKSIQNGEMDGRVVEIDGTSKKMGSNYSIGQISGGEFIGTTYTFEGVDIPESETHVKVTGTVVGEGFLHTITATSVEVVQ